MVLTQFYVRVGLFGHVGRFNSAEGIRYPRRTRVICRTSRGTEVGEVLASAEPPSADITSADATSSGWDGSILRRVTVEDQLIIARLERDKDRAFRSCQELLRARGQSAVLMEVEHLFDGRSLYFYFLGDVPPDWDHVTQELAVTYDAEVQFQQFAQTLSEGCGPGCGTEAATGAGCGSTGCSSCSLSGGCGSRRVQ